MAAQLVDMLGMSLDEATNFLDMAGGDVEAAMNLYFSMMNEAGPDPMLTQQVPGFDAPEWWGLVWPDQKPPPESWAQQGLRLDPEMFGIPQHKNGPCGVLAVVQAVLAAQSDQELSPTMTVTDEAVAAALSAIIGQCCPAQVGDQSCALALWPQDQTQVVPKVEMVKRGAELTASILANMTDFTEPGGVLLLVYSCLLTRTPEQVRKDLASEMENGPLILAPTFVCSMPLMGLMMRGQARGSISAYSPIGGQPTDWPPALGVGLLSFSEVDSQIPVCDTLKTPAKNVWVLHGGDHFTVGYSSQDVLSSEFLLWQYNGLPPGGPRTCRISVCSQGVAPAAAPGPRQETFLAPVPGQVEGVVQCDADDKKQRPGEWNTWRYEVVLAVSDPDCSLYGKGRERTEHDPEPTIFDLGEAPGADRPWRCASCYRGRFKTMCFGQNAAGAMVCEHCNKPQAEAGWSLWVGYDELPPGKQAGVTAQHAPKIISLLATKWPGCSLDFHGEPHPSV
eukprot:TRINITY_DN24155_c0_g1_i1.p1 TRINITY_DN24155_c0_g1~~TRINITY_DN24155_c0_g1_i1.p1  ORF type:complete len:506 (+),score=93.11 TRINITY_DN24155_c0_g1_i1:185-1702(+)